MADWITGREIIIGAARAAAWRSAAALGPGDGLLITREKLGAKAPRYVADESLGLVSVREMIKTREGVTGSSLDGYLRFEGWDLLLALALGSAGTPAHLEGEAYSNHYSPSASLDGLFATMALKKAGTAKGVWEIPSVKVTGFTIKGAVGDLVSISFQLMGSKLEIATPVNADLGLVTAPAQTPLVKFDASAKIRMNGQSGGALTDGDRIFPHEFEVSFIRPFEECYEAGYADMSEPAQSGFIQAGIKLSFDKYSLDDFTEAIAGGTDYKMDLSFTGGLIIGASHYVFRLDLPKVTWLSASADVDGPGLIRHKVEGRLLGVTGAPEGMDGVTGPLAVYAVNRRATSPLA